MRYTSEIEKWHLKIVTARTAAEDLRRRSTQAHSNQELQGSAEEAIAELADAVIQSKGEGEIDIILFNEFIDAIEAEYDGSNLKEFGRYNPSRAIERLRQLIAPAQLPPLKRSS